MNCGLECDTCSNKPLCEDCMEFNKILNNLEIGVNSMKKRPLHKRIKIFLRRQINRIKYRNTKWCYDGTECNNCGEECCKGGVKYGR